MNALDSAADRALVRTALADSAHWFLAVVAKVGGRWAEPGLGEWTVRETVGHTARALLTIEEYLGEPVPIEIASAGEYFARGLRGVEIHRGIAERGRQAGKELSEEPLPELRELARRALNLVDRSADDAPVATRLGAMTLIEYLRTRVLELTVHTLDLVDALGIEGDLAGPPAAAAGVTLGVLTDVAVVRRGDDPRRLLRALTGRGELPAGFNAIGPDVTE